MITIPVSYDIWYEIPTDLIQLYPYVSTFDNIDQLLKSQLGAQVRCIDNPDQGYLVTIPNEKILSLFKIAYSKYIQGPAVHLHTNN